MLDKRVLTGCLVLGLVASAVTPAAAETDHLWPTFTVDAGSYTVSTSDKIKVNGEIDVIGREINVGTDIGLPEDKTLLSLKLEWAFADRHSLNFGYWSLDRSGSRSLAREVEIGGVVFPVGADASLDLTATTIDATYTYWFVRGERFGFGGSFGLVYLGLDADASASVRLGGTGGTVSESASASTDLPVPMVGVALKGSPWSRLVLYGRAAFLPSVTVGDYSGQAGAYSFGADFYVWGPLAVGASFEGTYYDADIEAGNWNGSVDLSSNGFRFYLKAGF